MKASSTFTEDYDSFGCPIKKSPIEKLYECSNMADYEQQLHCLPQRGRIELIMGCMFAGKSTELLRRIRKHEITGKKVFNVKFLADQRYS